MKLAEIREKTVEELNQAVVDYKKQLFDLRMQKALQKLEDTSKIGKLKKEIAQIKTVLRQKEQ